MGTTRQLTHISMLVLEPVPVPVPSTTSTSPPGPPHCVSNLTITWQFHSSISTTINMFIHCFSCCTVIIKWHWDWTTNLSNWPSNSMLQYHSMSIPAAIIFGATELCYKNLCELCWACPASVQPNTSSDPVSCQLYKWHSTTYSITGCIQWHYCSSTIPRAPVQPIQLHSCNCHPPSLQSPPNQLWWL